MTPSQRRFCVTRFNWTPENSPQDSRMQNGGLCGIKVIRVTPDATSGDGRDAQLKFAMSPIKADFPRGWFASNLPGYRETKRTYGYFDYDELPPISEKLCGDFAWLTPMDDLVQQEMQPHWDEDQTRTKIAANFERIVSEVTTRGFALPETFLHFMRSEALQKRIPSSTACYFDGPERIVESPAPGEGILIRFLNDQQWCVLWYLYLDKNGAHAVLASDRALDLDEGLDELDEEGGEPLLCLCAQDFEELLYRFWLENSAWYVLHQKHRPLTPTEAEYLEHYRK